MLLGGVRYKRIFYSKEIKLEAVPLLEKGKNPVAHLRASWELRATGFIKWRRHSLYDVVEGYRHALLGAGLLPVKDIVYLATVALLIFGGGIIFRKSKFEFVDVLRVGIEERASNTSNLKKIAHTSPNFLFNTSLTCHRRGDTLGSAALTGSQIKDPGAAGILTDLLQSTSED